MRSDFRKNFRVRVISNKSMKFRVGFVLFPKFSKKHEVLSLPIVQLPQQNVRSEMGRGPENFDLSGIISWCYVQGF